MHGSISKLCRALVLIQEPTPFTSFPSLIRYLLQVASFLELSLHRLYACDQPDNPASNEFLSPKHLRRERGLGVTERCMRRIIAMTCRPVDWPRIREDASRAYGSREERGRPNPWWDSRRLCSCEALLRSQSRGAFLVLWLTQ